MLVEHLFNTWEVGCADNDTAISIKRFDQRLARYNIRFLKCQFENNIVLNYSDDAFYKIKSIEKFNKPKLNLDFENCIFKGDINIKEIKKTNYEGVYFEYCTFEKFIYLGKSELNSLNIFQCEFKGEVRFVKTNIKALFFDNLKFKNTVMLSDFENELFCIEHVVFGKNINSYNAKIKDFNIDRANFNGEILFKYSKISQIECSKAKFKNLILKENQFIEKTNFIETIFRKKLNLSHCVFEKEADFSGCKFGTEVEAAETIDLSSIIFEKDAKFDKSYFNNFVAFHMSSFNGTASFYKCHFNTIPNFSPADFKGILNINNASWGENNKGFDFENIKELIENAYKNESESNDPMENVKNIRNSFCGVKHKLIQQDNLLDAQNFHKAELYCKEIELEKETQNNHLHVAMLCLFSGILVASLAAFFYIDFSFDTIFSKVLLIVLMICSFYIMCFAIVRYKSRIIKFANFDKQIDRVLLLLYRYTSEHHTNFSKIFHTTLIVIASYGGTLFILNLIVTEPLASLLLSMLIFLGVIFVLCWFYNEICELLAKIIIYFAVILVLFNQPSILNPVLGISQSGEHKNAKLNEIIDANKNLLSAASIIVPDNLSIQNSREIIIENKNIIKDSTELNASFDGMKQAIRQDEVIYSVRQSMSVIYLILLILCIFSLQKTARKNTIVPS